MEIKYENLLENIELNLANICQFLGFDYSKSMMEYVSQSTYPHPDKSLCYQWKHKYSIRELSLVESKAGEMLLKRGYGLSSAAIYGPDVIEKLKLYFQNKLFRANHQISTYGLLLFLKNFLARKLSISGLEKALKPRINTIDIQTLK